MYNKINFTEIVNNDEDFFTQKTNFSNNQYHSHDYYEIFFVISGSAIHCLNNIIIPINTGDLFILKPNDFHSFKSNIENFYHRDFGIKINRFESICNFFNKELLKKLQLTNVIKTSIPIQKISELEQLFENISSEENIDIKNSFFISNLISILTCLYSRKEPTQNHRSSIWLNSLISELSAPHNFSTPIGDIISKFPYDKSYISRSFKNKMGKSPTKFFLEQRLQYAYMQLKHSYSSVSNVIEQAGFFQKSSFYKLFKEKYGISPSELWKENKHK